MHPNSFSLSQIERVVFGKRVNDISIRIHLLKTALVP